MVEIVKTKLSLIDPYQALHFRMYVTVVNKGANFICNEGDGLTFEISQVSGMYIKCIYIQVMERSCRGILVD